MVWDCELANGPMQQLDQLTGDEVAAAAAAVAAGESVVLMGLAKAPPAACSLWDNRVAGWSFALAVINCAGEYQKWILHPRRHGCLQQRT